MMKIYPRGVVMLLTVCATEAFVDWTFYKMVDNGQSITGKTGKEVMVSSDRESSLRCLTDVQCDAYHITRSSLGSCILIYKNFTVENGQTFSSVEQTNIYVCTAYSSWNPPTGWTGPDPVVYRSFDCPYGLKRMEGTEQADFPLVQGQINCAISLDHTKKQWVDLGTLEQACIARPETCGAAGGSVAFWMRRTFADHISRGVISSQESDGTGFQIYDRDSKLRFQTRVLDGKFYNDITITNTWIHIVLNFIGPAANQGIRIYKDGVQLPNSFQKNVEDSYRPGVGRVVIGRPSPDGDSNYASVIVDELLFFDTTLSEQQVSDLTSMI